MVRFPAATNSASECKYLCIKVVLCDLSIYARLVEKSLQHNITTLAEWSIACRLGKIIIAIDKIVINYTILLKLKL